MKHILAVLLLIGTLHINPAHAAKPIEVVTTIGQITDIVENIGQEHVHVQGLMGAGVDPHLYKASERDVQKIYKAQIIFYNGLYLEAKMQDIFQKMSRKITTVAVGEAVPKEKLLDSLNYSGHYDPHIWFDVELWTQAAEKVAEALTQFDPVHKEVYQANLQTYKTKLSQLHSYVHSQAQELPKEQRILVTAHDAFRYFGQAYDFEVVGLQGVSTESEAGTADVKRIADFITENKIKAIFVESSVPVRNIKAVQDAVKSRGWDVTIGGELFSDAMGSEGTVEGTYIGMVTHNIDTIIGALK